MGRFEALIQAHPELEDTFDGLFDALESSPEARHGLDALMRWQADQGQPPQGLGASIRALLENPAQADRFLRNPAAWPGAGPSEWDALGGVLDTRPETETELMDILRSGIGLPGVRIGMEQWAMALGSQTEGVDAAGALDSHLLQRSSQRWSREQQQRARQAPESDRHDDIRDWHRRVQRHPVLRRDYLE